MNICRYFLSVILCVVTSDCVQAEDKSLFHPPETEAEKVLDKIFTNRKTSAEISYYILQRPGYNKKKSGEYAHFFTPSLLESWAKAGKRDIEEGCNGIYKGEICHIDFDVLTCSQDVPDTFLYRTTYSREDEAIITYTWPENLRDESYYRMIKTEGAWKLDSVDCKGKYQFNVVTPLRAIGK